MVATGALCACQRERDDPNVVRGKRLSVAAQPADAQARIYEAAARGSFDVDGTSLLIDHRLLPRTIGLADGGRLADSVVEAMRRRGTIKGSCEPPLNGPAGTARCEADLPGYVLRFSPVFAITADSVQVYVYAQKYDTPASGMSETLRFERAYQVVRQWRRLERGSRRPRAKGSARREVAVRHRFRATASRRLAVGLSDPSHARRRALSFARSEPPIHTQRRRTSRP
jgi:hypothetical protein